RFYLLVVKEFTVSELQVDMKTINENQNALKNEIHLVRDEIYKMNDRITSNVNDKINKLNGNLENKMKEMNDRIINMNDKISSNMNDRFGNLENQMKGILEEINKSNQKSSNDNESKKKTDEDKTE